ncbi:androgen-dependent TFPI-regulating protein-like [Coccinella septempunctata]|uniref:androgen-dependent TFPI-regulating protein-like n=1 Tax=Coccinella septempunctata TaxID=41139 RepID=UPI001D06D489|nr:androgen-dependent TFPI-regulating protein-like [Coccinella septempunctata]
MEEKFRLGFHSIVVACFTIASIWALFLCDFENVTDDRVLDMQKYGGRYFTTWNFLFQLVYFSLALSEDFLLIYTPCESCLKTISKFKGYIFTSFVVPYTTYVFVVFWSLFKYDRELVFPSATDEVVPLWFNHMVHTVPLVFMVFEFYFTERNVLPDWRRILVGFSIMTAAYFTILFHTKSKTGRYFYGIFHLLAPWQIIIFIISSYFLALLVIKGGIYIQQLVQMSKNPVVSCIRKIS